MKDATPQAVPSAAETTAEDPDSERIEAPESEKNDVAELADTVSNHQSAVPDDKVSTESRKAPLPAKNTSYPSAGYGIPKWGHIHRYRNGICAVCGSAPDLLTDFLPLEFYSETENSGTVYLHEYEIPAYEDREHVTYNKRINIYLPYGYDESRPYNVLVLVHGGGGSEDSWLNDVYYYDDEGIQMRGRVIFDNMFEKGICDPCIIVCPVTEIPQCQGIAASTIQLRQELREYILPYVAEHYSTYAADSSLESLMAARDHFGLGGLSNGALFVYEGGMCYNFDLFGSYAAFSGNGSPWETVNTIQQSSEYRELPINCYFTGAGTVNDWQIDYTRNGYNYFVEQLSQLEEGKNAWHVDVEGGHEWKVWFTDIFNALPLMFPSSES
ncbi:MAG: hypothetical protein J6Z15_04280 [Oscillospiraceae bacterium]|nr:hypothetical protein [Oscillospiraceae bacterium]